MLIDQPTKVVLDPETNMTTATMEPKSTTDEDEDGSLSSATSNGRGTKTATPRFEGFPSWERMLQDWTDDVQEYMNKIDAENAGGGYPMSSWGTPSKGTVSPSNTNSATNIKEDETLQPNQHHTTKIEPKKKKETISLPVPAAAQDGEPVLPHTDISDKSKRIWIVTTAALPWMTGTAVNPLLRAAYMTEGRNEAGGSVTLMLPWLERRLDQENVYGKDRLFESCEEQERYVRDWLRDTAKLPKASEELNIEWYTAWQNKVENSIYSMGDITALIPAEAVDICILEEPEHLNWYVLKSEAYTSSKFYFQTRNFNFSILFPLIGIEHLVNRGRINFAMWWELFIQITLFMHRSNRQLLFEYVFKRNNESIKVWTHLTLISLLLIRLRE